MMDGLSRWGLILAVAAGPAGATAGPADGDPLHAMVAAERAFAATSAAHGMHRAFSENLAENSVLFRPGPVNGAQWFRDHPPRPGLLTWEPAFAYVSAAGDLGYTTGPWEFRKTGPEDSPIAFGHFVSTWRKQPDGRWMVELDIGSGHPALEKPLPRWETTAAAKAKRAAEAPPKVDVAAAREALLEADRAFSRQISTQGIVKAYGATLADDARYHREGVYPILGKAAILADLKQTAGSSSWQPDKAEVAASGDLGYTYGSGEKTGADGKSEPHVYTRIWRKEGRMWKVALDIAVAKPLPPPPPAAPPASSTQ